MYQCINWFATKIKRQNRGVCRFGFYELVYDSNIESSGFCNNGNSTKITSTVKFENIYILYALHFFQKKVDSMKIINKSIFFMIFFLNKD